MALLEMNYLSKSLFRTVPVYVYLPADKISFEDMEYSMKEGEKFKTLYLLHGLLGNYTDWVCKTRLTQFAEEKNVAVVMPSGDNAFYVDSLVPSNDYGAFIGEELVQITRKMFPLSDKREDTFIAGLSMGGFGAVRNGIRYAETFGYVAGLSGAYDVLTEETDGSEHRIFGKYLKEIQDTDRNPKVALEDLIKRGAPLPAFYLACGSSDQLLDSSLNFRDLLIEKGAKVTWDEQPGGHDWEFWDMEIKKVLDWLPVGGKDALGLGSGNVRTK